MAQNHPQSKLAKGGRLDYIFPHMGQLLLIPDPRPLDRRLGPEFFRNAPHLPGVYLMKDAQNRTVYVGKAKDLQHRLNHYRRANPDRMGRRQLRLVNEVSRIDFQICETEAAALRQEKKLIRSLKPRFNRAGVWPGRPKFVVWQIANATLDLAVVETPSPGWQRFGPLGGAAAGLMRSITRLLWLAVNAHKAVGEMPAGWARGACLERASIHCGVMTGDVTAALDGFFWSDARNFLLWLTGRFLRRTHLFEQRFIGTDLEFLAEFVAQRKSDPAERQQLALL